MNSPPRIAEQFSMEEYVVRCWQNGFGISETRKAVGGFFGLALSSHDIQKRFVQLSWGLE